MAEALLCYDFVEKQQECYSLFPHKTHRSHSLLKSSGSYKKRAEVLRSLIPDLPSLTALATPCCYGPYTEREHLDYLPSSRLFPQSHDLPSLTQS